MQQHWVWAIPSSTAASFATQIYQKLIFSRNPSWTLPMQEQQGSATVPWTCPGLPKEIPAASPPLPGPWLTPSAGTAVRAISLILHPSFTLDYSSSLPQKQMICTGWDQWEMKIVSILIPCQACCWVIQISDEQNSKQLCGTTNICFQEVSRSLAANSTSLLHSLPYAGGIISASNRDFHLKS